MTFVALDFGFICNLRFIISNLFFSIITIMDLSKLKIGDNPPYELNVVIEIPQGSSVKYEVDKISGFLFVDRFNFTSMFFPFNYGFVPSTKAQDGDPLDILVVSSYQVSAGSVIKSRPVGMLEMEDESGIDTKIIAVPVEKVDPFYSHISEVKQLGEPTLNRIKHFFDHYKELEEGKWVKTKDFLPKNKAYDEINKSIIK